MVWLFKSSLLSVELGMGADCWTEHLSSLNVVQASQEEAPKREQESCLILKGCAHWAPDLLTSKLRRLSCIEQLSSMWGRSVFCLNPLIHRVCLFPSLSVPTTITQKQASRALTCSGPFLSFTLAVYPCVKFGIYFFCGFRAVASHTLLAFASLSSFPPT